MIICPYTDLFWWKRYWLGSNMKTNWIIKKLMLQHQCRDKNKEINRKYKGKVADKNKIKTQQECVYYCPVKTVLQKAQRSWVLPRWVWVITIENSCHSTIGGKVSYAPLRLRFIQTKVCKHRNWGRRFMFEPVQRHTILKPVLKGQI